MENITSVSPAASSSATAPAPKATSPAPRATSSGTSSGKSAPAVHSTRMSLDVDKDTGRVIGRSIDSQTGEVLDQIPSPEMIRLLAKTREMLGALLDEMA